MGGCVRWVLGVVAILLALCVGCAALGYFVGVPRSRAAVADQMAAAISTSVAGRIEASARPVGELVLRPADLDVNNAEAPPGESGIDIGSDGTRVYGFATEISPEGTALVIPGNRGDGSPPAVVARGMPTVEDGRVELTQVEGSDDAERLVFFFVLSADTFERGMVQGINRALAAHRLTPTSVELRAGRMTIRTEPAV